MIRRVKQSRMTFLVLGLIVGTVVGSNLSGFSPSVPLHAVASHGHDNFAIATGFVDDQFEAIYFLDFLTGDLKAAVMGSRSPKFLGFFQGNVLADFGGAIGKNPQFLMVTGAVDFPRGGSNVQMANSVVYIAEATTGQVACYVIPWNAAIAGHNKPQLGEFVRLDSKLFRTPILSDD